MLHDGRGGRVNSGRTAHRGDIAERKRGRRGPRQFVVPGRKTRRRGPARSAARARVFAAPVNRSTRARQLRSGAPATDLTPSQQRRRRSVLNSRPAGHVRAVAATGSGSLDRQRLRKLPLFANGRPRGVCEAIDTPTRPAAVTAHDVLTQTRARLMTSGGRGDPFDGRPGTGCPTCGITRTIARQHPAGERGNPQSDQPQRAPGYARKLRRDGPPPHRR